MVREMYKPKVSEKLRIDLQHKEEKRVRRHASAAN